MMMNVCLIRVVESSQSAKPWKRIEVVRLEVNELIWGHQEMDDQMVNIFLTIGTIYLVLTNRVPEKSLQASKTVHFQDSRSVCKVEIDWDFVTVLMLRRECQCYLHNFDAHSRK